MNKFQAAVAALATILCTGQSLAADPVPALSEPQPRQIFELKGIVIGADMETVKASLVSPDCETMADGSIAQCFVKDTTFGGKPADLLVRFLDGKVVYVAATKMTQGDAFDAAEGLKAKFGPPTFMNDQRVTLVRPDRDRSIVYTRPVWKSADGTQELKVNPSQYTDKKRQFTYAAVVLTDVHLHNNIWMAKMNGKSVSTRDL